MRIASLALSLWVTMFAGCVTSDAPAATEPSSATAASAIPPGPICPAMCHANTFCRLPDDRCAATCNSCFCAEAGGTIDSTCGLELEDEAAAAANDPRSDPAGT